MKVAVLGNKNLVLPFKALGCEVFYVENENDFHEAKKQIENHGDFAILFIIDETAKKFEKEIEYFYNKTSPAVLVIPKSKA